MRNEMEYPSAGRIMGINLLLAAFIYACGFTANLQRPTEQPVESEFMWQEMESPLFPDTWPSTAETVWVRYTFAYGITIMRTQ